MTRKPVLQLDTHSFVQSPHRTFLAMSVPVLFSMIAEPVTGLVDTAFIARLEAEPLAALGVGTVLLFSIFWVLNFLGVGTQTEVAQSLGRREPSRATEIAWLAVVMGFVLGLVVIVALRLISPAAVSYMGAENTVHDMSLVCVNIRLFGAPAVLITIAVFGAMRGCQDMRTPLWIAVGINLMNILLDAVLIFGLGPFPELGIAAIASGLIGIFMLEYYQVNFLELLWIVTVIWISVRAGIGRALLTAGIVKAD